MWQLKSSSQGRRSYPHRRSLMRPSEASCNFTGTSTISLHLLRSSVWLAIAALLVSLVGADGELNWREGVLLPAVYVIIAPAFFFLPAM
jgi:hypothetical protein